MIADLLNYYTEGGPFMFLVTFLGLITLTVIFAYLISAKKSLLWASIGLSLATLFLGGLGTVLGLSAAADAIAALPPDFDVEDMIAQATALAWSPTKLAIGFFASHLSLGGLGIYVHNLKKRM